MRHPYRPASKVPQAAMPQATAMADLRLGFKPELDFGSRYFEARRMRFADRAELVGLFRRRLVLPEDRERELEALLEPDIAEVDGWVVLGPAERELVTVWWQPE